MMNSGLYRVIGTRRYREHRPGDLFEAKLDPGAEARAIGRGDIELVERIQFTVKPGSYRLPRKEPSDG
jgi:hypothetical protein